MADTPTTTAKKALTRAVLENDKDLVSSLINQSAPVNARDEYGQTPLYVAATHNYRDILNLLLEAGAEVNAPALDENTPLHEAIYAGREDLAVLLLDAGADPNMQNNLGRTPLHVACFDTSLAFLVNMMRRGVNLTVAGNDGETVLHLLCQRRDMYQIIDWVIGQSGVNINAQKLNRITPLMVAAYNGVSDVVRLLVLRGANRRLVDNNLDNAAAMAIEQGHGEIARFLMQP